MDFRHFLFFLLFSITSNSARHLDDNNQVLIQCIPIDKYYKQQMKGIIVHTSKVNINYCGSQTQFIEIFAEEKVIIDKDIILKGRQIQLAIIAPIWEVNDNREINLDGIDAVDFKKPAADGNDSGNKHGEDGNAGLPGGSAGSFYGVTKEIINENRLIIFAKGGLGGKGQMGGHGANGRAGVGLRDKNAFDCDTEKVKGFKVSKNGNVKLIHLAGHIQRQYTVEGQTGSSGGRGGNGGVKGLGGYAGNVLLFDLSKSDGYSYVVINEFNGLNGSDGVRGIGGFGGQNGESVDIKCDKVSAFSSYTTTLTPLGLTKESGPRGAEGLTGESLRMRQLPKTTIIIQNFPQTINEYKLYIRSRLNKIDSNKPVHSFYDSLNSRQEITKLYDAKSLVDEFTGLESQYFLLEDRDYLTSSYVHLSGRFQDYLNNANYAKENDRAYKDILRTLQWLIQERIAVIQEPKGYTVLTNIADSYNSNGIVPKEVLSEIEDVYYKVEALNDRINSIDNLTNRAKDLIKNELQVSMKDLQNTLDTKIDTLLKEITELIKSTIKKENELIEKRQELQTTMLLKGIFGILKITCGVVSVLNPALGVAAAAGTSALSVAESFITDTNITAQVTEIGKIGQVVTSASDKFLEGIEPKQRETVFNNHISNMVKNMSNTGKENVRKMKDKLINIFKGEKTEQVFQTEQFEPMLTSYKSYKFDSDFQDEEISINNNIRQANRNNDMIKLNDCKIQLNVLKFIKVSNEVLSTGSATMVNIMTDVTKVNEIDKTLKSNADNLKKLYNTEEGIYSKTQPMIEKIFTDINQVKHNMNKMDRSEIVVANWKVLSTIEEVQRKLNETFQRFNTTDDINWTLQKLSKTFQVITNIHIVITQNYDRISESKFVGVMHLPKQSRILSKDHKFSASVAQLKKVFHQNKLKDMYKEWIYAFKQYSFPKGGEFLQETGWPYSFVDKDVNQITEEIKANIDNFLKYFTVEKEKRKLVENIKADQYRGSCSTDGKAFFVWKKENSNQVIANILRGHKTTIVSKGSAGSIDSLKFNKIGIVFTSMDNAVQNKLFTVLSTFRVNLTHHGDSTYKFNNKYFIIETKPINLDFKYPKERNQISSFSPPLHEEFGNGDCVLSPYATWTVELIPEGAYDLTLLEGFIGRVDLELIGEANSFKPDRCGKLCQDTMTTAYKLLAE
ncbi:uncharacterized protein LOC122508652 [Leptopilina heterotoma]|uniref:uncharacterized protein LOC122508652 n=1 Tax=Leptopilina heterotoma TaxID=63436 RepID=UPI001CA9F630|nr:uncharacterized protein LOC122508652 [Leptopilina heterotoma]